MELYFVMGYDASVDRFILLKHLCFDCYEDAQDYALECDENLGAFVVQQVKE
jgi:hypothetical protein